jgi:hypothetical protein
MESLGQNDSLIEMRVTVGEVLLPVPRRRLLLSRMIRLLFYADS